MRHRTRRAGVELAIVVLSLTGATAGGEEKGAEREAAREQFLQGERHYAIGEFSQAAEKYREAYRLYPQAAFLFNLGQCYRFLGDREQAIFYFEGFIRDSQNQSQVVDARRLITELRKAQAAEKEALAKEPIPTPPAPPGEPAEAANKSSEEESIRQGVASEAPAPLLTPEARMAVAKPSAPVSTSSTLPRSPQPTQRAWYQRWWVWAGVGAAIGGTVLTAIALRGSEAGGPATPEGSLGSLDWSR